MPVAAPSASDCLRIVETCASSSCRQNGRWPEHVGFAYAGLAGVPFGRGYESFAQRHHLGRNTGLADISSPAADRVSAYHPVGFPGRPEVRRGSLVAADDVWALAGTPTWSRRGMTFDVSVDMSLVGRSLRDGVVG